MGHIAEAEVESGRIFAQRLARSPYLKSWDASWPDSGRGIAELRSARKYGGLNQRYFDSTSPPIEPRCTAADCAEVGLGSLGRRLREHCSGKPLLRPSSALVGKPVPVVMVNSMCLGNYDPRAGGLQSAIFALWAKKTADPGSTDKILSKKGPRGAAYDRTGPPEQS